MRPRQNARAGVRTHRPGPEELVQTAAMARLFYLENKSKIEIAEEFGISRFKVARMLGTGDRGDVPRTHRAAPLYSRAAERGGPAAAHRRQRGGGRAPDRFCRPRHRVPHLRPTAPA